MGYTYVHKWVVTTTTMTPMSTMNDADDKHVEVMEKQNVHGVPEKNKPLLFST